MRAFVRNLFFVCLILAVFLVGVELSFRVLIRAGLIKYPPPPADSVLHRYTDIPGLIYEMKPGFTVPYGGDRTNSFGMRDREYNMKKPDGVFRICVVGDSVAYGWRLKVEDTFANLIEERLNARGGNLKYEVLNFSVSGYCSSQEEIVLARKVMPFSPDMVIIAFCHNDNTFADGMRGLDSQMSPYSLGGRLHSKFLSFLLDRYEKSSADRLKNDEQIKSLFLATVELGKENGFVSFMLDLPYYFSSYDEYELSSRHELINGYARERGLGVIDFSWEWKDMDAQNRRGLFEDTLHLSAAGMKLVADKIIEFIDEHGMLPDSGAVPQRETT